MNKAYIIKFCEEFDYPEEAVKTLCDAADFVENEPTLCKMFEDFLDDYNTDKAPDPTAHFTEMTAYARSLTAFPYESVDLLFYVLHAEHLEEVYEKAGLSRDRWHNAMNDLYYKMVECHDCKGIWGTFVGHWFPEFFSLKRVALGRLQYQPNYLTEDIKTQDGKYELKKGQIFIDTHIPSSGKLDIGDVKASLKMATEYFGDKFEGDHVWFGCESWLLFDKHREWLPATSGIVQFMDLFSLGIVFEVNPSNDLWRIFNTFETSSADRHKLPEDTLLRRKYKDFLTAGGKQGSAFGIIKMMK